MLSDHTSAGVRPTESETGTCTEPSLQRSRVRHRGLLRARPHPRPAPARWSACASGRRVGGSRVSGPCRTARVREELARPVAGPFSRSFAAVRRPVPSSRPGQVRSVATLATVPTNLIRHVSSIWCA